MIASGLRKLGARVEALSTRTRVMVLLALMSALILAWDLFAVQPLNLRRAQLQRQVQMLQDNLSALHVKTRAHLAARGLDPDEGRRQKLKGLMRRADGTRGELMQLMAGLVPPREVPRVLEHMLARHSGLKLLKLEGLGPEPVSVKTPRAQDEGQVSVSVPPAAEGEKQSAIASLIGGGGQSSPPAARHAQASAPVSDAQLYRHGMTVIFEGGYLAALSYLSALENASWKLFWDAVEVEVKDYPVTRVSITVFSLSTDEAWIGV